MFDLCLFTVNGTVQYMFYMKLSSGRAAEGKVPQTVRWNQRKGGKDGKKLRFPRTRLCLLTWRKLWVCRKGQVGGRQHNPGDAWKEQGTEMMSTSGAVESGKLPRELREAPTKGTPGSCWVGKWEWKKRLVPQRRWEICFQILVFNASSSWLLRVHWL